MDNRCTTYTDFESFEVEVSEGYFIGYKMVPAFTTLVSDLYPQTCCFADLLRYVESLPKRQGVYTGTIVDAYTKLSRKYHYVVDKNKTTIIPFTDRKEAVMWVKCTI